MKCRIWRKLHAEEARRFDRVYDLMEKNSELGFEDAFGVLQSGLPPAVFLERKAKAQKKAAVKQARGAIAGEAIDAFLQGMIQQKAELSVVLAERTLQDVLRSLERVALVFERGGRLEKLQVILISRRTVWDKLTGSLERDPKLADNPSPIIRQPERRPVSDPRPFLPHVGQTIDCVLRNGLMLKQPLRTVGPFDLLLGSEEAELFVPLHAIVRWAAAPLP